MTILLVIGFDLVARLILGVELADGDWRILGARLLADIRLREGGRDRLELVERDTRGAERLELLLLADIRLREGDRDRLELVERDTRGAERLELRERETREVERVGRETDRLDRLNERAETRDRPEDERELVRRPLTWAVTVSIATEASTRNHRQRFGWADMTDLLA